MAPRLPLLCRPQSTDLHSSKRLRVRKSRWLHFLSTPQTDCPGRRDPPTANAPRVSPILFRGRVSFQPSSCPFFRLPWSSFLPFSPLPRECDKTARQSIPNSFLRQRQNSPC